MAKSQIAPYLEKLLAKAADVANLIKIDENGNVNVTDENRKKIVEAGGDLLHKVIVLKSREKLDEMDELMDDDEESAGDGEDISDMGDAHSLLTSDDDDGVGNDKASEFEDAEEDIDAQESGEGEALDGNEPELEGSVSEGDGDEESGLADSDFAEISKMINDEGGDDEDMGDMDDSDGEDMDGDDEDMGDMDDSDGEDMDGDDEDMGDMDDSDGEDMDGDDEEDAGDDDLGGMDDDAEEVEEEY